MLQRPETELAHIKLLNSKVINCKVCMGAGCLPVPTDDPFDTRFEDCECRRSVKRLCSLMDANLPREYWDADGWEVEHNTDVFDAHILPYCNSIGENLKVGRGILMFGENGVGKTTFAAYILLKALDAGATIGYVLAYQLLVHAIDSRGNSEMGAWFRNLLAADFLVIDEMGKEHKRPDSGFALAELDLLLRTRRSNLKPTIMVTNMNRVQFIDSYGASIESITKGALQIHFEGGDHRSVLARRGK